VVKSKFETGKKLAQIRAPVLIIHCTSDPVIPFSLGEDVFRAANEPKSFLRVEGVCHEEACLIAPEIYRAKLREFLAAIPVQ